FTAADADRLPRSFPARRSPDLAVTEFLTDVETLRERARAEIQKGPITDAYGADLPRVIQVLNEVLDDAGQVGAVGVGDRPLLDLGPGPLAQRLDIGQELGHGQIGRASCRERAWQSISVCCSK